METFLRFPRIRVKKLSINSVDCNLGINEFWEVRIIFQCRLFRLRKFDQQCDKTIIFPFPETDTFSFEGDRESGKLLFVLTTYPDLRSLDSIPEIEDNSSFSVCFEFENLRDLEYDEFYDGIHSIFPNMTFELPFLTDFIYQNFIENENT